MSTEENKTKPVTQTQTAPAKKEPDLPKFEKDLSDKIVTKFGADTEISFVKLNRVRINVKKEKIIDVFNMYNILIYVCLT